MFPLLKKSDILSLEVIIPNHLSSNLHTETTNVNFAPLLLGPGLQILETCSNLWKLCWDFMHEKTNM